MVSEQLKTRIIEMAEGDWIDDYSFGQVKPITINEVEIYGLNEEELKIYVDAYNAKVNESKQEQQKE